MQLTAAQVDRCLTAKQNNNEPFVIHLHEKKIEKKVLHAGDGMLPEVK